MENEKKDKGIESEAEGVQTLLLPSKKLKVPSFYKVVILNDDFTPQDFVVEIFKNIFGKDQTEATQLMLNVHYRGAGIAGIYTHEVAEMKACQVNEYARQNQHPLKCTVERT